MNVKRFTARTSRDALTLVRQAFGEDAVVLSTKPCAEGVEVLAMAPESMQQIERLSASSTQGARRPAPSTAAAAMPALMQRQRQREDVPPRRSRQLRVAGQPHSAEPISSGRRPVSDDGLDGR